MYSCPLHNWFSDFVPCPSCITTITTSTIEIPNMNNDNKQVSSLDEAAEDYSQGWGTGDDAISFKNGVLSATAKEYWFNQFLENYKQVFEAADVPLIFITNPELLTCKDPSDKDFLWAKNKIKEWQSQQTKELPIERIESNSGAKPEGVVYEKGRIVKEIIQQTKPTGLRWVKASDFNIVSRKKYYAKYQPDTEGEIKTTGYFQSSDGTFFWYQDGYIPILKSERSDLYILDESRETPLPKPVEDKQGDWKIIGHSHQIADTGDYDGCYEITNGKMSFYTKDGDDEDENSIPKVVKALNECDCDFYLDDSATWMLSVVEQELKELRSNKTPKPVSEEGENEFKVGEREANYIRNSEFYKGNQ